MSATSDATDDRTVDAVAFRLGHSVQLGASSTADADKPGSVVAPAAAEAADANDISDQFDLAQQSYMALQNGETPPGGNDGEDAPTRTKRTLATFLKLAKQIEQSGIFSANETVDDINTIDLKYLLCSYFCADLFSSMPGMDGRLTRVKAAIVHYTLFLDRAESYGLLSDAQRHDYHGTGPQDAASKRQAKIDKFKRNKEDTAKLKVLVERRAKKQKQAAGGVLRDDELEEDDQVREYTLLLLSSKFTAAIDGLGFAKQEFGFLAHRAKLEADEAYARDDKNALKELQATAKKPVMHVITKDGRSGALDTKTVDLNNNDDVTAHIARRVEARRQVFREANPATMSVEEGIEEDIRTGAIQLPDPTPGQPRFNGIQHGYIGTAAERDAIDQIERAKAEEDEKVEPQTEAEVDAAMYEAREWAAYTDENERGAGNKKRNW